MYNGTSLLSTVKAISILMYRYYFTSNISAPTVLHGKVVTIKFVSVSQIQNIIANLQNCLITVLSFCISNQ